MDDRMTPESLRARFATLGEQREGILARSTPLREQRDLILSNAQQQAATICADLRDLEAGLFDIDQERAMIARALGGRTGEPDAE